MKYSSQIKSMPLDLFTPDLDQLPKDNRWVKLGDSLPWDKIELVYNSKLNNGKRGAGNKPARMIIGALLIKHKLNLSDEETSQKMAIKVRIRMAVVMRVPRPHHPFPTVRRT